MVVAHITVKSVPVLRMGSIDDVIELRVLPADADLGPTGAEVKLGFTPKIRDGFSSDAVAWG